MPKNLGNLSHDRCQDLVIGSGSHVPRFTFASWGFSAKQKFRPVKISFHFEKTHSFWRMSLFPSLTVPMLPPFASPSESRTHHRDWTARKAFGFRDPRSLLGARQMWYEPRAIVISFCKCCKLAGSPDQQMRKSRAPSLLPAGSKKKGARPFSAIKVSRK